MSTLFAVVFVLVFVPLIIHTHPTGSSRTTSKRKEPYKVYRIYPNSTSDLEHCVELWKSASHHRINFWKEPSRVGAPVDVMVPGSRLVHFEALLNEYDLGYMVTIQDVQKLIEERERPPPSKSQPEFRQLLRDDVQEQRAPFFDFRRYHSYEDMRIYMRSIERRYPEWAKVYSLGFTHEGRPIEMIKIGYPLHARGKKSIWIDAGIHAREWASTTTAVYFIHQLTTKFSKDPQITQYVKELNWYIAPVLNPDGYEYTRSSTDPEIRMWRKNRSPNRDVCRSDPRSCCVGVDLNRNFDFHWGESGASDNPCEEIYQGSSPFSEPESRAVRDFILAHKNDVQAVITMHTYSQIWVHPFGHQRYSYPDDVDDLRDTGTKAVAALEKLYGTKYKVGSGADTLYPAAGGSDDWSKSKAGIKFVYLLELRPEENVWDGFILDADEILPTARETWEGVKVVVNNVLKRLNIEPVTDDSDLEGSVADNSPKQSPPFSSLRRFGQRERTEPGGGPDITIVDGTNSSSSSLLTLSTSNTTTISIFSLNGTSPTNAFANPDATFIDFGDFGRPVSASVVANSNDTAWSPISSPPGWIESPGTPVNLVSNWTVLESLLLWFDLAQELIQRSTKEAILQWLPFNQSVIELPSNQPIIALPSNRSMIGLLFNQSVVALPSNQSVVALSFNQSMIDFLFNQSMIDLLFNQSLINLPFNQSATERLPFSQSATERLLLNQSATGQFPFSLLPPSPLSTLNADRNSLVAKEILESSFGNDSMNLLSLFLQNYTTSLDPGSPHRLTFLKSSNTSSPYRLYRVRSPLKSIDATNNTSYICDDSAGEHRCLKWVQSRDGICQRAAQIMRKKCAKTCLFCKDER